MAENRIITGSQHALLSRLTEVGPEGASVLDRAFTLRLVRSCERRGLIVATGVSGFYRITPLGEVLRIEHEATGRRPRGFGAMRPERVSEIASMGGVAAHKRGTAHKFTKGDPLAVAAGKKGSAVRLANFRLEAKKEA